MKRKFYEVPKRILLLIAGLVWMAAGFNITRLGILSYMETEFFWYMPLLSVVVFGLWGTMFFFMARKHTKRILAYEKEYQPFGKFFDIKSYIIMVVMMGAGIGLRTTGVLPVFFVAFFYTGLGASLFLAGVVFIVRFVNSQNK